MELKWGRYILNFFAFIAIITTSSTAGTILHGPALKENNSLTAKGSIIIFREDKGDTKKIPVIFINDDIMASLLPGEYAQTRVCSSDIKIRVGIRGDLVTAGQSQMINLQQGKITYIKISETPDKTFVSIIVNETEGQKALSNIKYSSNIVNRFIPKLILDGDNLFAFNSAVLLPSALIQINKLVDDINMCPEQIRHIKLIGHTDRIGNEAVNKKLSTKRADAVAGYLIEHNIKIAIDDIEGHGSKEPITTNCTGKFSAGLIQCLQPDRRVDVKLSNNTAKQQ